MSSGLPPDRQRRATIQGCQRPDRPEVWANVRTRDVGFGQPYFWTGPNQDHSGLSPTTRLRGRPGPGTTAPGGEHRGCGHLHMYDQHVSVGLLAGARDHTARRAMSGLEPPCFTASRPNLIELLAMIPNVVLKLSSFEGGELWVEEPSGRM